MEHTEHTSNRNDLEHWVDDRLAALSPDPGWQPMASAHLASIDGRRLAHRNRRLRWAGAAMAATIVVTSVPITRAFAARCIEACVNVTTGVSQLWRADEPEAGAPKAVGLSVGDIVPDLAGIDRAGRRLRISSLRGRMVVLNFWATWCGPCKAEVPLLNDLQSRFRARGLEVIGVSIDEAGWPAVNEFAAEQNMGYAVTLADDETIRAFGGVTELPMTLIIDRDGRIIVKRVGVLTEGGDYDQVVKLFER
jgi:peroxiredoxin